MTLKRISKQINISLTAIVLNNNIDIKDVVLDSRIAKQTSIFVAIKGFKTDGHKYIENAYNNGCRNFVVNNTKYIDNKILKDSSILECNDTRKALALISNILAGYPFLDLLMIGVTGTKGKTTVTSLLYKFLTTKYKGSMFSTITNIINNKQMESHRTTMEANKLQQLLKQSKEAGDKFALVEVSSHAITLKRVEEIQWDIAIFTSFSQDHLDLYGTMENYFQAKLELFKRLNKSSKKNKLAVINMDDPKGKEITTIIDKSVKIIKVGNDKKNDYVIKSFLKNSSGLTINLATPKAEITLATPMKGKFNVTNIALATALSLEMGIDIKEIQNILKTIKNIKGRFDIVLTKPFTIIIDYAHTPASLQNILNEARSLTKNRVICVFGCTGERDREKRPIMGEIAAEIADISYITNDDTYGEEPFKIAKEVEKGFIKRKKVKNVDYMVILDRYSAIYKALSIAIKNDVIVIAGKGHETTQILNEGEVEYSDYESVKKALKLLGISK